MVEQQELIFLVDTGASRTVLDESVAARIWDENTVQWQEEGSTGLGTNDHQTGLVLAESVKFGPHQFGPMSLGVMNLSHLRHVYEAMEIKWIPDGVLGNDILTSGKATIHFQPPALTLFKP